MFPMGWGMTIPRLAFQHGSCIHLGLLTPRFWLGPKSGSWGMTPGWEIPESLQIQEMLDLHSRCGSQESTQGMSRFPLAQLEPGGKGAGTNIPIKSKLPIPARAKQKQLLSSAPQILQDNKTSGKLERIPVV